MDLLNNKKSTNLHSCCPPKERSKNPPIQPTPQHSNRPTDFFHSASWWQSIQAQHTHILTVGTVTINFRAFVTTCPPIGIHMTLQQMNHLLRVVKLQVVDDWAICWRDIWHQIIISLKVSKKRSFTWWEKVDNKSLFHEILTMQNKKQHEQI